MTFHPITANWLSPGFEQILAREPELFAAYDYPDYPGGMTGGGNWVALYLDDTGNDPVGRLWFAPDTNGVGIEELPSSSGDHLTRIQLQLRDLNHNGVIPAQAFDFVRDEYFAGELRTGDLADAQAQSQG